MNKVAQFLQSHLIGEVITSAEAREYFSTDGSIFKLAPHVIIYPRSENDVRKTARFSWQLAERGRVVPITARGSGTDQAGGALGTGVMLVFPAHLNKILALNSKKGIVSVQPGLNYGKLQQTLFTHGQFLPPFPASLEYSTIGGAVANNAAGEKTIKYGVTKDYVKELRVVLANGEVIKTGRLSRRQVNKKMSQATFEGEIYRAVSGLLSSNKELISKGGLKLSKNSTGYNIWDVPDKHGSIDLTPLFVGSQGTLGIITEATIETEPHNPQTTLLVGFFDSVASASETILKLRKLAPSALEMVDKHLLDFIDQHNPDQLKGLIDKPLPKIVLLIEFDDSSKLSQSRRANKAAKILNNLAYRFVKTKNYQQQSELWKIRHSAAAIMWHTAGKKKALPIIEDGVVPNEKFAEFIQKTYKLFNHFNLDVAIWGHAGNANLHMQPFFDLSLTGERQKIFKLMNAYYQLVIELGGSTSGEHNDGRLRGPYLKLLYGQEVYGIFEKIKQIFDPYGIMNPGVKMGVNIRDLHSQLRSEYSISHLSQHMPRT